MSKVTSGGTTLYSYDQSGHLLEESSGTGTNPVSNVYLDDLPIAQINAAGTINYLHADVLGTPQKATSTTPAVTWTANYSPFGAVTPTGTITQNLRFPGQYFDAESNFHQNGFRDYSPVLGRYLQSDPIGVNGNMHAYGHLENSYGYANGNPMTYTDPTGLRCDAQYSGDCAEPWYPMETAIAMATGGGEVGALIRGLWVVGSADVQISPDLKKHAL